MTSPVALYLASYLDACGEPGWTPDPSGAHVVTRGEERIRAHYDEHDGWHVSTPERLDRMAPAFNPLGRCRAAPVPREVVAPSPSPELARRAMGATQYPISAAHAVRLVSAELVADAYVGPVARLRGCVRATVHRVGDRLVFVGTYDEGGTVGWTMAEVGTVEAAGAAKASA